MAKYEPADIRNIALIGHNDSGKTSLAEAFLYKSKTTDRLGRVADGNSTFDFEPEERERKVSIDLAVASLTHDGKQINVVDTPGYSDFVGEAVCALNAVETALLCINAGSGIMVNSRKMWQRAVDRGIARVIVANKIDNPNVNYPALIESIRSTFGRECVPVLLPSGTGGSLKGVVNLMAKGGEVPADLQSLASEAREKLMEVDDALLEKFLEGKEVSTDEVAKFLPAAIQSGKIVPILCSSVEKDVGIVEILDFIAKDLPSPVQVGGRKGEDPEKKTEIRREVSAKAPFSAQVFKEVADPFVGRLCYLRIFSGSLSVDQPLFNQRTGKPHRIGKLFKPFGKEERPCPVASAGDIVCVTKVEDLKQGDTVCDEKAVIRYPHPVFPTPMVAQAVEPKSKQDLAHLSESLTKMAESDPTFKFSRDQQTAELLITGMSKLHIEVILSRLKRKFDVSLITHEPKIPFKEAINGHAEGHHKHKKQSGGHGQYGEVHLRVKPTARGEGFKFTDSITQGRIPHQFVPAIEKGIRETLEKGVIAGYPIVDVEVEVFDGSYHDVDSSPAAFQLAGSKAFKKGFQSAKPVVLEPIVTIEITVPSRFMGDITGDLNSRRGRILGMDTHGDLQVIKASIPYMEITNYETQLRSATSGEGSYTFEPSHYDILPGKLAEALIAKAKKHEEEDED